MADNKWSQQRLIGAFFLVGLVILVFIGGTAYQSTTNFMKSADWRKHTYQVIIAAHDLLIDLIDAETGARGYVITGNENFLEPFQTGVNQTSQDAKTLRELTQDNPHQQQRLDRLDPLIATKLDDMRATIDLRKNQGFEVAAQHVLKMTGKKIMDDIRETLDEVENEEYDLLKKRDDETKTMVQRTIVVIVFGSILAFLLVAIAGFLINRDILMRREAEAEAERTLFFTLSLDMLCIASSDGYFKRLNPAFTQTLGWSVKEMLAKPFLDFVHPDDHASTLSVVEKLVVRGEKLLQFENRYQRKDGSYRLLSWNVVPQPGGMMYATARDVTDQKQSEERFRLVVEAAPNAMLMMDQNRKITLVNQQAETLFGYSRQEVIGQEIEMLIPERFRPRHPAYVKGFFQEPKVRLMGAGRDLFGLKKDGTEVPIEIGLNPIQIPEGLCTLASIIDISERKKAENLTRESNIRLEAANKELETFSYSVSHDLRAPLRHIDGFMDLLLKSSASKLDANGLRQLGIISDSAKQMGLLIDDLLLFSRMGRAEMQKTTLNIEQLVKQAIENLAQDTKERKVSWKIGSFPPVHGDPAMLKQVFSNLLGNALKYSGNQPTAQIEVSCTEKPNEVVFFVKDNGVGFDMQYADKLFGVFQRLHSAEEFEGTGIGLANVRRIVQRHGGKTWAEGAVDGGATFYFSLPK